MLSRSANDANEQEQLGQAPSVGRAAAVAAAAAATAQVLPSESPDFLGAPAAENAETMRDNGKYGR